MLICPQGMDMTTDKLRSLVKKWQTLIECFTDVKTTDGFILRIFCIAFTKKRSNQIRKTSYAQSAQVMIIVIVIIDFFAGSCYPQEDDRGHPAREPVRA
jgi:small subunit ribosomal protein S3Ae